MKKNISVLALLNAKIIDPTGKPCGICTFPGGSLLVEDPPAEPVEIHMSCGFDLLRTWGLEMVRQGR